ncbi:cupin domain-containing protein [Pricia sp. S334]|uniref:Cupin domain-containing protein n=1 Tax=Pricia mediterranea TaxID=3076079 RepID=A0ABU3LAX4_9FLAO|nr:cupin domain-containing protein [Pricia sp. S334]MDT7830431.1 cupin domain-containing protein [Pricia sp. S334]
MKTINKFRLKHLFKTMLAFILVLAFNVVQGQNSDTDQKAIVWETDDSTLKWGPCPGFMPEDCRIAVLQGNPKKPNTDVFFKMQGNTTVPRHWHNSPERMVLVSGKMRVNYDGQDSEIINTGDYAYGPAERPHEATCLSDEPCILFIAFEDPIDAMPMSKTEDSKK